MHVCTYTPAVVMCMYSTRLACDGFALMHVCTYTPAVVMCMYSTSLACDILAICVHTSSELVNTYSTCLLLICAAHALLVVFLP
jgi:hypothetical protein